MLIELQILKYKLNSTFFESLYGRIWIILTRLVSNQAIDGMKGV